MRHVGPMAVWTENTKAGDAVPVAHVAGCDERVGPGCASRHTPIDWCAMFDHSTSAIRTITGNFRQSCKSDWSILLTDGQPVVGAAIATLMSQMAKS